MNLRGILYCFGLLSITISCTIVPGDTEGLPNVNYANSELQYVMYKGQELLVVRDMFPDFKSCMKENIEIEKLLITDSLLLAKNIDSLSSRKVIRRSMSNEKLPRNMEWWDHTFVFFTCINPQGYPIVVRLISTTSDHKEVNRAFMKLTINNLYEASPDDDCLVCMTKTYYTYIHTNISDKHRIHFKD